jgi:hypothetical protein
MPSATASPCSSRSPNPVCASSACPKVWPKLRSAGLALVGGDDRRLHPAADEDGAGQDGRLPAAYRLALGFEPIVVRGVAYQAVFDDLAIAGPHLARRQCSERAGVGQHQARLVEGAEEVLARSRIDRGLAADRAVDLRQEGRRDLHEVDAAQEGRGGEPGDVADHPAAERHQHRAAFDATGENILDEPAEMSEVLGPLSRRQDDRVLLDADRRKAVAQCREMMPRHVLVGDDDGLTPAHHRRDQVSGAGDQPGADQDLIAALAEFDAQAFRWALRGRIGGHRLLSGSGGSPARGQAARAAMTWVVVASGGPAALSTVRSASA